MKTLIYSIITLFLCQSVYAYNQEKIEIKNVHYFLNKDKSQTAVFEVQDTNNQTFYFNQKEMVEIFNSNLFKIETYSSRVRQSLSENSGDGSGGG